MYVCIYLHKLSNSTINHTMITYIYIYICIVYYNAIMY